MPHATVTKRELSERVAVKLGMGQVQVLEVMQAFLDEIVGELSRGNRFEFRDFGVFETVMRNPRTALNPKTLAKIQVPARMVVKFKPGRMLRQKVAGLPPGEEPGQEG